LIAVQAFGLVIHANLPIPGLENAGVAAVSDLPLRVHLEPERPVASPAALRTAPVVRVTREPEDGAAPALVVRRLAGGLYHFGYRDGTEFVIDRAGTEVRGTWRGQATLEDTATYLLGPVLAFVLRLRGFVAMHAGAVEVDGGAVLLVGPSGAGKSTTTAAFALHGWPVLTDDVAAVAPRGEAMEVVPSYPRVRLWGDAVHGLLGDREALPLLTPTWDKRYLPLGSERAAFSRRPLPLRALYLLGEREDSAAAPRIAPVPPLAAFPQVLANVLASQGVPGEPAQVDFRFSSRLVERVPAFALTPHADPARLGELCRRVAAHAAALPLPAAPGAAAHV